MDVNDTLIPIIVSILSLGIAAWMAYGILVRETGDEKMKAVSDCLYCRHAGG